MKNLKVLQLAVAGFAIMAVVPLASQGVAQMKQPKMVTLSGTIADLTCASKGNAMMGNWHNAENNDHMTPEGTKRECATMCLRGGQPAALFASNDLKAVLACSPQFTLANFAAQDVEVQGFYAGGKDVKTFVPQKIRAKGGSWEDVQCAEMH